MTGIESGHRCGSGPDIRSVRRSGCTEYGEPLFWVSAGLGFLGRAREEGA